MKKFLSLSLSLVVLLSLLTLPDSGGASPLPAVGLPITARSAVLLDAATQKFIYAKAPYSRRPPASTTKVMTALVVLDRASPQSVVRIPSWVRGIAPSKAYLRPGERYRVRDLLHAMLISSANDAAEVLAVATAGSRAKFAERMNERAHRIGCRSTHFVNPSGLPASGQYSTSYDLALIMREARKNSLIVDSLGRKYHTIQSLEGRGIRLRNHNRLLWRNPSRVIGKTGYTRSGMHCFVGRIQWGGREVLVSLLGSHRLWHDLKILLDYQFGVALYKIYKNQHRWSGSQVRKIQTALARSGYQPGPVDGELGPKTVRAIERFQRQKRIHPDGLMGPHTCRRLTPYGLPRSYCR